MVCKMLPHRQVHRPSYRPDPSCNHRTRLHFKHPCNHMLGPCVMRFGFDLEDPLWRRERLVHDPEAIPRILLPQATGAQPELQLVATCRRFLHNEEHAQESAYQSPAGPGLPRILWYRGCTFTSRLWRLPHLIGHCAHSGDFTKHPPIKPIYVGEDITPSLSAEGR
jgi:hypothetical protein